MDLAPAAGTVVDQDRNRASVDDDAELPDLEWTHDAELEFIRDLLRRRVAQLNLCPQR